MLDPADSWDCYQGSGVCVGLDQKKTGTTFVHADCPSTDVLLERNRITLCEETFAGMVPSICGPVTWRAEPADAVKLTFSIDPVNGVYENRVHIKPLKEHPGVKIIAELVDFLELCHWEKELTISGDCSSCSVEAGSPPGSAKIDLGSIDVEFSMGNNANGVLAGVLRLHSDVPADNLASPSALQFPVKAAYGTEIIRESEGALRQVLTSQALANIVTEQTILPSYRIEFYSYDDRGTFNAGTGLYEPDEQDAFVVWLVAATGTDNGLVTTLRLTRKVGGVVKGEFEYSRSVVVEGQSTRTGWRLQHIDPDVGTIRDEEELWTDVENPPRQREYIVRDNQQQVVYHALETYETIVFEHPHDATKTYSQELLTQRIVDPEGAALTTTRRYYTTRAQGTGQVKSETFPDGSWVWYEYDVHGRMTKMIRPWKDTALANPDGPAPTTGIRRTTYQYQPHAAEPNDTATAPEGFPWPDYKPREPRTVIEEVIPAGGQPTVVGMTFYAHYRTGNNPWDICYSFEQRATDPSAAYEDPDDPERPHLTLITTTIRENTDENRPIQIIYPDGRQDWFEYARGDYDPNGPTFTPTWQSSSLFERTAVWHTADSGAGNVDTSDTRVKDRVGNVVLSEVYRSNSQNAFDRLSWTKYEFDDRGRLWNSVHSNGERIDTAWSCCNVESRIDEHGIQTAYVHDILGGLSQETKVGTTGQADLVTKYGYDAMGRLLSTIVGYGSTDPPPLQTVRHYDIAGRLEDETDPAGLETSYLYETGTGGGRKVTVTRPGGFTEITEYYRDGRVKSVAGTAVVTQAYDYGVNTTGGEWTQVFTGSAGLSSPRWTKTISDIAGRTLQEQRPAYPSGTATTTHTYDTKGRHWKMTSTGSTAEVVNIFGDEGFGEFPNTIVRSGQDLSQPADGLQTNSSDRITDSIRSYDSDGTNWWSTTITKSYPKANNNHAVTLSTMRTRLTGLGTEDGEGWMLVSYSDSTDINGNTTIRKTEIKRNDKLARETVDTPDSDTDAVTITLNGLVQSSTSTTGVTTTYVYDAFGRRTQTIDPRSGPATTVYNSLGQVYQTKANGNQDVTTYAYHPDSGRLISVSNPAGKMTYYDYTSRGETWRAWGDVPQPTEMGYDGYGQRTTLKTYRSGVQWNQANWPASPPTADTTTWTFDSPTGLLTRKTYADGKYTDYTYTADGRLYQRKWFRQSGGTNITTTYSYDAATRELTGISYSDGTPAVTFTHYRFGAMATAATAGVTSHAFEYADGDGFFPGEGWSLRLLSETQTGLVTRTIARDYETAPGTGITGRPTGLAVAPNGGSVEYDVDYFYDAKARLNRLTGPGLPNAAPSTDGAWYTFSSNSDLVGQIDYKNNDVAVASVIRQFEPNRDLIDYIENKTGATTVSKYDYASDNLARRTSVVTTGTAFSPSRFTLFTYNDRHEVATSKRYNGTNINDLSSPVTAQHYIFSYDPIGNRTSYSGDAAGGARNYWTNVLNQYTSTTSPTETFVHDLDGNLTEDGSAYYVWDGENRLIEARPKNPTTSSKKITFAYDYMGRRVRKQAFNWTGSAWSGSPSLDRRFIYDGWNLLEEIDALASGQGPAVIRQYTWGLDLSGQGGSPSIGGVQGAGGIGGLLAMKDVSASKDYLYFYDGNGNVCQLIDASDGSVDGTYEYYPYGGELVTTGIGKDHFFRFSTKYLDVESRAYYYGYRYHMPKHGRWLNRDPLYTSAFAPLPSNRNESILVDTPTDEFHLLAFVLNTPSNKTDPLGLLALSAPRKGFSWKWVGDTLANNFCGNFAATAHVDFSPKGAPCAGYIVQEVFFWLDCDNCEGQVDNGYVHFFEAIEVRNGAMQSKHDKFKITSTFNKCRGSASAMGSSRFFCKTATGDLGQQWGGRGTVDTLKCCGQNVDIGSGTFPHTRDDPDFWNRWRDRETFEDPRWGTIDQIGRFARWSWDCCCKKSKNFDWAVFPPMPGKGDPSSPKPPKKGKP